MSTESAGGKLPVINLRKTGENIARMRREAGISVRELQVVFGFTSPQSIYSWQSGKSLPSVDNLIILAAILGVTIDEIVSVEEDNADPAKNGFDQNGYDQVGFDQVSYDTDSYDKVGFDQDDKNWDQAEIIVHSHLLS